MAWSGYSEQGKGSEERGPSTFALQLPGGVSVNKPRPAGSDTAVRMGVEGGEVRNSTRVMEQFRAPQLAQQQTQPRLPEIRVKPDKTMALLAAAGDARMAQVVKQAEQEAYVRGAARAASGEAMVEIANEQPWYSKIFGDTALVEGARAYTVKAGVAQWTSKHLADMGELAKQSPDAIPGYLSKSFEANKTGDPATDQVIAAEMMGQVPGLIKEHTKQHYMHLQKQAAEARRAAMHNSVALLEQSENGDIEVTEQGRSNIMAGVASTFAPPEGADPQAHYDAIKQTLMNNATAGNFKSMQIIDRMGYTALLAPEDQMAMKAALVRAAPAKIRQGVQMLDAEIGEFYRNMPLLQADRDAGFEQLNQAIQRKTGVTAEFGKAFDYGDRLRADASIASGQARAMTRAAKAAAEAGEHQALVGMILNGNGPGIANLRSTGETTGPKLQQAYNTALTGKTVVEQAQLSVSFDTPVEFIKTEVENERRIAMGDTTKLTVEETTSTIERYKAMNREQRRLYYGNEYGAVIDEVARKQLTDQNVGMAFLQAKMTIRSREGMGEAPPPKDIQEGITDYFEDKATRGVFGQAIDAMGTMWDSTQGASLNANEATRTLVGNMLTGALLRSVSLDSSQDQIAVEMSALEKGGEITLAGSNIIINEDPRGALESEVWRKLDLTTNERAILIDTRINRLVKEQGFDPNKYVVYRRAGKPEEPITFTIYGKDDRGIEVGYEFTSQNIKEDQLAVQRTIGVFKQTAETQRKGRESYEREEALRAQQANR